MKNNLCDSNLSFSECELTILRNAVDKAEKRLAVEKVRSPNVKEIISIVELYLKNKKLICYGGTAINNILPKKDQFYNYTEEIPDYDFFSPNALNDAKELADIYYSEGFKEVEAKAGVHHGTYKVFVDFIPVADITQLSPPIFKTFKTNAVQVDNILYTPPDALRMFMYLELSRPLGDVSRWEKVLKRISLLNKNYPLQTNNCNFDSFQRIFEGKENFSFIYDITKNTIIDHGYVFFGGYASYLYSRYMKQNIQKKFLKHPDFDILAKDPKKAAEHIKSRLINEGLKNVKIKKHNAVGDHSVLLLPLHYEVSVGKDMISMIYQPLNCHSYNKINISGKIIKVATIDTMLSFYLSFIYANRDYYDINRILCMSKYLFQVQQHNRLAQKGLLRRFSIECYGNAPSFDDIRIEKSNKFKELKNQQKSKEYESLFLKYRPDEKKNKKIKTKKKFMKNNKKKKTLKKKNIVSNIFNIKI